MIRTISQLKCFRVLRKTGNRYRFEHGKLREHFAAINLPNLLKLPKSGMKIGKNQLQELFLLA